MVRQCLDGATAGLLDGARQRGVGRNLVFGGNRDMSKAVRIRTLVAPDGDLSEFDPGAYLSALDFYETSDEITETDRNGLAQILHFLEFLATNAQSRRWSGSVVAHGTSAYNALASHFGDLPGWHDVARPGENLAYSEIVRFLLSHYPPRRPPTL